MCVLWDAQIVRRWGDFRNVVFPIRGLVIGKVTQMTHAIQLFALFAAGLSTWSIWNSVTAVMPRIIETVIAGLALGREAGQ